MTKAITDYTRKELLKKINAIKAERLRTAKALKRYEEELEKRKDIVPLGVPYDGEFYVDWKGLAQQDRMEIMEDVAYNCFPTEESAEKHSEMLLAWRKDGLIANAKGEPIDIKVLLPLSKKNII